MRPLVLAILDGWGHSDEKFGNAILSAKTPNIDDIKLNYPSLLLQASGEAVGLNYGETGNSEVGHLTIGAGRTVFQYLSIINKSINDGEFFNNETFLKVIKHTQENNSSLHLIGLLTSGSVHAYFNHLIALINLASRNNISKLNIHLFTDGRDSGLKEAPELISKLQSYFKPEYKIATIIGRDYAMDRDNKWDRTEKAFNLLTKGQGKSIQNPAQILEENYKNGLNDPNIEPAVLNQEGVIKDNDAIIFFNFREDSMRQIVRPFIERGFDIFKVEGPKNLLIVTMTPYIHSENISAAFRIPQIKNGLSEIISKNNLKQFHIAETEKYAHVTYFFNCLNPDPFRNETDLFIDSDPDPTSHPEMKSKEIADKVISEIKNDHYEFMVINFANADILSHLGDLDIVIKGIEAIDRAIGKIKDIVLKKDGFLIITADHGNAESLIYKGSGEKETKHDINPVPFYLIAKEYQGRITDSLGISGILSDVAPTILGLLKIEAPVEMTGENLIEKV